MSEAPNARNAPAAPTSAPSATGRSPGAILRAARQAQGLHIAALAASIKVQQRKLEALEADRYDELPDATFARALAKTICRTLKIDSAPVLELLPRPVIGDRLEHVSEGINEPFREGRGRHDLADWSSITTPKAFGLGVLVLLVVVVYLLPQGWVSRLQGTAPAASDAVAAADAPPPIVVLPVETAPAASEPTLSAASAPLVTATPAATTAAAAAVAAPAPLAAAPTAAPTAAPAAAPPAADGAATLLVKVNGNSWIGLQDASAKTLVSRTVAAGETLSFDVQLPARLTVGNAAQTEVTFRGQPVDLVSRNVGNVVRMELK